MATSPLPETEQWNRTGPAPVISLQMRRSHALVPAVALILLTGSSLQAQPGGHLSTADQLAFLKSARIVGSRPIGKGVTGALRLTLTDGRITHDAAFQRVNKEPSVEHLRAGQRTSGELSFVDSYRYNIAAWELARLVGLDHMVPATVERFHGGERGALSWWVDEVAMDEAERERIGAEPPAALDFARQRQRMVVFAELVRDTDRNKGNVVYTTDWRVIMLDFTRAFRVQPALRFPQTLSACDRELLGRMRVLTRDQVSEAAGRYLKPREIDALMKRRDLIVAHFDRLVLERGERAVLY
jgi:hypothetical protein